MIGFLSAEQCTAVLMVNCFGRIGCNDGFNTYVFPTGYVFDGSAVYCQSLQGSKVNIMRSNPRVCLEVEDIQTYQRWKSVMVNGIFEELSTVRDRYYAIKVFSGHMIRVKMNENALLAQDPKQWLRDLSRSGKRIVLYRIRIEELTGRFEDA
jgi:nitroimidazol reductase NimA-like FMN-containing flavoprotein (pyridoxamine 5'-phosphate oxidase superfamily)